jgi:hypothetical protein
MLSYLRPPFRRPAAGNVRWGNRDGNGDWGYSVVDASDKPTGTGNPRRYDWTENADNFHSPTFSYAANGAVSLSLGSGPASTGTIPTGANTVLVRARGDGGDTDRVASLFGATVELLADNASILFGDLLGDSEVRYIGLIDPRLASGFTIGTNQGAKINGGDGNPVARDSWPAYQFKVGANPVPAPSVIALLGFGVIALGYGQIRKVRS